MTNKEKYNNIFTEVFGIEDNSIIEALTKENTENWDSVHQLNIVALLEESFDLMLDPEDIMALTSYSAGLEILAKNDIEI